MATKIYNFLDIGYVTRLGIGKSLVYWSRLDLASKYF